MVVEVSNSFEPDQVVMPGNIDKPKIIARSRMSAAPAGESADSGVRWNSYNNTSIIEFFAHTGSHIDVPFHVHPDGYKLHEFEISDFIFENPVFLEIPKQAKERITVADLAPHKDRLMNADILLIYTGYSKIRQKDPVRFVTDQPSFALEAADYLVDNFNIRAYGIDTIGIENIPEGKASSPVQFPVHKVLLLKKKQKTLVIEDLNLSKLVGKKIVRFFAIPLRLYDVEAMPVTVFAEVED